MNGFIVGSTARRDTHEDEITAKRLMTYVADQLVVYTRPGIWMLTLAFGSVNL